MNDTQPIDPQALQNMLDSSSVDPVSLLPEALTSLLPVVFFASIGLTIVFLLLYVLSMLRKRKMQSAIFQMQKDIAEIKQALAVSHSSKSPNLIPRDELNKVDIASTKQL